MNKSKYNPIPSFTTVTYKAGRMPCLPENANGTTDNWKVAVSTYVTKELPEMEIAIRFSLNLAFRKVDCDDYEKGANVLFSEMSISKRYLTSRTNEML